MLLWSCGYLGPVQPPSLHIPVAVTDLSVQQRAGKMAYSFTLPELTTDNTAIDNLKTIDLRIGPNVTPSITELGRGGSKPVAVPEPVEAPARTGGGTVMRMDHRFPAGAWVGKGVVTAVRTAQKGRSVLAVVKPDTNRQSSNPPQQPDTKGRERPQRHQVTIATSPKRRRSSRSCGRDQTIRRPVQEASQKGPEFIDTGADYPSNIGTPRCRRHRRACERGKRSQPRSKSLPRINFPPSLRPQT